MKKIEALQDYQTGTDKVKKGEKYEVSDQQAKTLIDAGLAKEVIEKPAKNAD